MLLVAGNGFDDIKDQLVFECFNMGMLDNNYGIASAYQAADLFVCPSIEDSGPSMINQSIMCGTPVVSFKMGVALDLVIDGKTGYIAQIKNAEELANGLYKIICQTDVEYKTMQDNCIALAEELWEPEKYRNNWMKIISNKK